LKNDKIVGLLTFRKSGDELEIISLDSFKENTGIGTALLNKVTDFAKQNSIKRLWLITTNDNLNALRFYQKRNWTITTIHKDAVTKAREIKPTISITGYYDIPLRHEIELEYEPLIPLQQ
jgi:ribosomal protein S18 acetylase RimI-like enzyme